MDNGQCDPQSIDNRDIIFCILIRNMNVKACADVNTYIHTYVSAYMHTRIHMHTSTVLGKILAGENFGELIALKSLARKNLANLLVVY